MLEISRFGHSRFAGGMRLLAIMAFLLVAGMYTTAVRLEANDSFCASCHVEPETSYYQASLHSEDALTLAAFHAGEKVRCIDCHSRRWIPGRLWSLWGGLQNLMAYRSGRFAQPSTTTRPVGDSGCSKCHGDLTWVSERPGHYHSPGLRRSWRAAGGPTNSCEACHPSHQSNALAGDDFMDATQIEIQCDACHESTGEGAIDLKAGAHVK